MGLPRHVCLLAKILSPDDPIQPLLPARCGRAVVLIVDTKPRFFSLRWDRTSPSSWRFNHCVVVVPSFSVVGRVGFTLTLSYAAISAFDCCCIFSARSVDWRVMSVARGGCCFVFSCLSLANVVHSTRCVRRLRGPHVPWFES